jgi:hypothetical protein
MEQFESTAPPIPVLIQPLEIPPDPKSILFGGSRKTPFGFSHTVV